MGEMDEGGLFVDMNEDEHQEYKENFADFMQEIQDHVKFLAKQSSRAPQDAYEAFQGERIHFYFTVVANVFCSLL